LAMYEPRINAQFIAPIDSGVTTPEELRGKALAFANPQSLVAMYGRQWLHQHGLDPQKDYEVKAARTDMGVGRMLLTGEVSAAIMSNGEFGGLPTDESTRLKIVEIFARIPNFVILGNPRLGTEKLARLKAEMLGFLSDPEDGARFAKATGFRGIVEADETQLRELDPFVELTRRAMAPTN
jgi:phosphonate transport system substrate-binding protein